jgi:hypothetical protein
LNRITTARIVAHVNAQHGDKLNADDVLDDMERMLFTFTTRELDLLSSYVLSFMEPSPYRMFEYMYKPARRDGGGCVHVYKRVDDISGRSFWQRVPDDGGGDQRLSENDLYLYASESDKAKQLTPEQRPRVLWGYVDVENIFEAFRKPAVFSALRERDMLEYQAYASAVLGDNASSNKIRLFIRTAQESFVTPYFRKQFPDLLPRWRDYKPADKLTWAPSVPPLAPGDEGSPGSALKRSRIQAELFAREMQRLDLHNPHQKP